MAVFTSAPFSWSLQPRAPQAPAGAGATFFIPFATIAVQFQPVHDTQHRANDGNGFVEDLLVAILVQVLVAVITLVAFLVLYGFPMMVEVMGRRNENIMFYVNGLETRRLMCGGIDALISNSELGLCRNMG
jgi:hypothetical protein